MSPSGGGGGVLHLADHPEQRTDGGPTGVPVLVLLAAGHVIKP